MVPRCCCRSPRTKLSPGNIATARQIPINTPPRQKTQLGPCAPAVRRAVQPCTGCHGLRSKGALFPQRRHHCSLPTQHTQTQTQRMARALLWRGRVRYYYGSTYWARGVWDVGEAKAPALFAGGVYCCCNRTPHHRGALKRNPLLCDGTDQLLPSSFVLQLLLLCGMGWERGTRNEEGHQTRRKDTRRNDRDLRILILGF